MARSRSERSGCPGGVRWSRQAGWDSRSVVMDDSWRAALRQQSRGLAAARKGAGPDSGPSVDARDAILRGRRKGAVGAEIGEQGVGVIDAKLRRGSIAERRKAIATQREVVVHGDAVGLVRFDPRSVQRHAIRNHMLAERSGCVPGVA